MKFIIIVAPRPRPCCVGCLLVQSACVCIDAECEEVS